MSGLVQRPECIPPDDAFGIVPAVKSDKLPKTIELKYAVLYGVLSIVAIVSFVITWLVNNS